MPHFWPIMIQTIILIGIPLQLILYFQKRFNPENIFFWIGIAWGFFSITKLGFLGISKIFLNSGMLTSIIIEVFIIVVFELLIRIFLVNKYYSENIFNFINLLMGYVFIKILGVFILNLLNYINIFSLTTMKISAMQIAASQKAIIYNQLKSFRDAKSYFFIFQGIQHFTIMLVMSLLFLLQRQKVFSIYVLAIIHFIVLFLITFLLAFKWVMLGYFVIVLILIACLSILKSGASIIKNSE